MSDPTPPVSPSPASRVADVPFARGGTPGEGEFSRLLATQASRSLPLPLPGVGLGEAASGLAFPVWDDGTASLQPVLMLTLLQVLRRLLDVPASRAVPEGLPVAGPVSQAFHDGHPALDIAVPVGTPVRATMSGRVIQAGWNHEGYGNLVVVENGPYRAYYAHLDRVPVKPGDRVEAGTIVGSSGNTGNSTGPHLHYEVRFNGSRVAPEASY